MYYSVSLRDKMLPCDSGKAETPLNILAGVPRAGMVMRGAFTSRDTAVWCVPIPSGQIQTHEHVLPFIQSMCVPICNVAFTGTKPNERERYTRC